MDSSTLLAGVGAVAIVLVMILAVAAIGNDRWNPMVVFPVGALAIAGTGAIVLWLMDSSASSVPLFNRMLGRVLLTLPLVGVAYIVAAARGRNKSGESQPAGHSSEGMVSNAWLVKTFLLILGIAVVIVAVWAWWMVASM